MVIVITAPAVEPVTLVQAKLHLRIDHSTEDDLLNALIVTARQTVEKLSGRALITQTLELVVDSFPDTFRLRPPLQSVTSIKYKDTDGAETTHTASLYITDTDSEPGRVVPAYGEVWPSTTLYPVAGVRVRFVAGYGAAETDVPDALRQALLLLIGHLYEHRESVVVGTAALAEVPWTVMQLISSYRMWGLEDL